MVPDIGIEPMTYRLSSDYSTAELIRCKFLVPPVGIEPTSSVLQTGAMTTFAKAAMVPLVGFEPTSANYLLLRSISPLFYH